MSFSVVLNSLTLLNHIYILDLDSPTIDKQNNTVNLTLTCLSEGNPKPTFQWIHLNKVLTNNSVLKLKNMNDTYISSYICVVKNEVAELSTSLITNSQCKSPFWYFVTSYVHTQFKKTFRSFFFFWTIKVPMKSPMSAG